MNAGKASRASLRGDVLRLGNAVPPESAIELAWLPLHAHVTLAIGEPTGSPAGWTNSVRLWKVVTTKSSAGKTMIVSMWMSCELVTIAPETGIVDAATLMTAKHVRLLPVVASQSQGFRLIGIISASDLRRAFPPDVNPFGLMPEAHQTATTVADIMQRQPITTPPDAPIEEAARIMRDRKIGALPVVRDTTLVGLITESDIFSAFVSMFESAAGVVRGTFDLSKNENTLDLVCKLPRLRNVRVHSLITAQEHDRPVCAIRFTGTAVEALIEDLWKSGHHVLNVLRSP